MQLAQGDTTGHNPKACQAGQPWQCRQAVTVLNTALESRAEPTYKLYLRRADECSTAYGQTHTETESNFD